ncbi:VWA-like domain-containing protein [Lachnospiraceae bacterium JLR.KK008]
MKAKSEKETKIELLAARIMKLARDSIIMHLRFLDTAMAELTAQPGKVQGCMACDGRHLYYDPVFVLQKYQEEPNSITHMYLHVLLHCIFYHGFQYDKLEQEYWDMAADLAVENTILEIGFPDIALRQDEEARRKLHWMKIDAGGLTAEKIYRYFLLNGMGPLERQELTALFYKDAHSYWRGQEELTVTMEQWKKISERVKTDLKTFSQDKNRSESLEKNLAEATREKYDYGELLRRFTVMGEDVRINEDEFDYVYYTYGLSVYGNLPLVEPLEYKEEHKIKEFVIALDTSASCRGPVVRGFLRKTYSILKGTENFFHKINVHIVQCDNEIQSDTKITCDEDFDLFMREGKLHGFGATDFRPVFSYIDELRRKDEFENLRGLIYFTDGYGIYPEKMPDYDVIFAFLDEDDNRQDPPPWAIAVTLYDDMFEEEKENEH